MDEHEGSRPECVYSRQITSAMLPFHLGDSPASVRNCRNALQVYLYVETMLISIVDNIM